MSDPKTLEARLRAYAIKELDSWELWELLVEAADSLRAAPETPDALCDCDYKQDGGAHSFDCPSLSTDKEAATPTTGESK